MALARVRRRIRAKVAVEWVVQAEANPCKIAQVPST